MRLSTLIQGLPLRLLVGEDREVAELTDDSRRVEPGWLFVARGEGEAAAGYAAQAAQRGAGAVIAGADVAQGLAESVGGAAVVAAEPGTAVDQPMAGRLAAKFFGHPARRLRLIGVTGTNGKTSVAYLVRHLLHAAGLRCGLLGTVEIDDGESTRPSELTTPGAIELTRLLACMVRHGCDACALECSSHALHQGRLAGLAFDAAVFTNLTGDHLDYHGTMQAYAEAKATLFSQLIADGCAVINADDDTGRALAERLTAGGARVVPTTVSTKPRPLVALPFTKPRPLVALGDPVRRVDSAGEESSATGGRGFVGPSATGGRGFVGEATAAGTRVVLAGPWGEVEATLPLVGRHNVSNALQAVAAAWSVAPLNPAALRAAVESMPAVPGRLERVGSPDRSDPAVFVDYAHTHDALENVLHALRPTVQVGGRLIVVFGCGGDRDRTKRPRMGEVACRLADRVWITSDNPRTEDPAAIIDEIVLGVPDADERVCEVRVEPDRAAAIARAVAEADLRDVVLIAGKGHEDYQIVTDGRGGTRKVRFDDREHAAAALSARGEKEGRACLQSA